MDGERSGKCVFREINFDSKPISEIRYMEEPHLKMTVGGGNTLMENYFYT